MSKLLAIIHSHVGAFSTYEHQDQLVQELNEWADERAKRYGEHVRDWCACVDGWGACSGDEDPPPEYMSPLEAARWRMRKERLPVIERSRPTRAEDNMSEPKCEWAVRGARLLLQSWPSRYSAVLECRVLEVAPSGRRVKVKWSSGGTVWIDCADYSLVERLNSSNVR